MEEYALHLILGGLGLIAVGFIWLVVVACLQWGWWVLIPPVFVFAAPIMLFVRFGRAWLPCLVVGLGIGLVALPAGFERIYRHFVPIDLGPREKMVDGGLHITLTGWDQNDYSVLRTRKDAVLIQMANEDVNDDTLKYLGAMLKLEELDISHTSITDAGLVAIENLPSLKILRITDTKITDKGFEDHIAKMPALTTVVLGENPLVSDEVLKKWKAEQKGRRYQRRRSAPKPTPSDM